VFWTESGYRDEYERITAVWGEFRELAPEGWNACWQRGPIMCARCGKPATPGPRMHIVGSGPENASEDLVRETAYVTVVPLDGAVVVRVYAAGELQAEARLSRRRALLLAQDALAVALIDPGGPAGPDGRVLEAAGEERVADEPR
jgi:hypothetical protein